MLDRIDAGAGRRQNSARAVSVGRDLQMKRMGGVDDRLHLGVGEMLFEPHCTRVEHAARRHDLDHVDAERGDAPRGPRAFIDAGAHPDLALRC